MSDKPFKMPPVEVGQIILWFPHGEASAEPWPAIVTRVGHANLCCGIFSPTSYNLMIRDGVRHVSDPQAKKAELLEQGGWDYTPRDKRGMDLEQQVRSLLRELGTSSKKAGAA